MGNRPLLKLWITSCSVIALAACGGNPTPAGDRALFLQDDFANPTSGWEVSTNADAEIGYADGQYRLLVQSANVSVWGVPGLDLTDLTLEADAHHAAGPLNNEFGALCRLTNDGSENSFYYGLISSDGYFALGKIAKNVNTILFPATGSFQPSSAILTGPTALNHLQLTCMGERIAFSVNGTALGEFTDTALNHGDVGLLAGTYNTGGVEIRFDNVIVKKP
jgi:hypothetical protein